MTANEIMIQQKMTQMIAHHSKGSPEIRERYPDWTDIYDFMICSKKCRLSGGGEKGLGDPNSPFSYSTKLATGRDQGDPSGVR